MSDNNSDDYRSEWEEHFNSLVSELSTSISSLELNDTKTLSLTSGSYKSTKEEILNIYELLNSKDFESSNIKYNGTKYVYVNTIDYTSTDSPYYICVALNSGSEGKKALLITNYYDMVLAATFDQNQSKVCVNLIDKVLTAQEPEE